MLVALTKPLKLKREPFQLARAIAQSDPFVEVLVDHQIVHLDQYFEYQVPELWSEQAVVGALVEVEFGNSLTQGVVVERYAQARNSGALKTLSKVLSTEPYILPDQIRYIQLAAQAYGSKPWDFLHSCVPPYSKMGERRIKAVAVETNRASGTAAPLPKDLLETLQGAQRVHCAIELPSSRPYWELVAAVAATRFSVGTVLLLVPNEREALLMQRTFQELHIEPLLILSTQAKSERYQNYLCARIATPQVIIGTRSACLLSLPANSTIMVLDDVDESHYERSAPTWNTRDLVQMREPDHSVIYLSTSLSLEIAARALDSNFPLYQFPHPTTTSFRGAASEFDQGYFEVIGKGLAKGSVLISVGATGYITSFSCQKCRNVALCPCGGKLYLPKRGATPLCSLCQSEFLEWSCSWCQGSTPRIVKSGVARRAEEFGKAFPNHPVIASSGSNPVANLPEGKNLVISTPGVEPRGAYQAVIFLDLEHRLLRTTLRATEEVRLQIQRSLSMLVAGGTAYFALQPSDAFFQAMLRKNSLGTLEREIDERGGVQLPPSYCAILISGESLESVTTVLQEKVAGEILGPFLRAGRKTILLKIPAHLKEEVVGLLVQVNRVQSMRKLPLLTYQIDPYSLN